VAEHLVRSQFGSECLNDFELQDERCLRGGSDDVTVVRMEVVPEETPSAFSCSFGEGHMYDTDRGQILTTTIVRT